MKLCGFHVSNYHNKVRLVLLEKGIPHEEDAACAPSQSPDYLTRSPMGKVPFLETEHGRVCESTVICEYLEEVYPQNPLLPKDPFARAKVRELVQVLELHVELVNRRTFPAVFFGGSLSDESKQSIRRELDKGVRAFGQLVKLGPFLAGPEFTLADCAAAVHLPMVAFTSQKIFGEDVLAGIPGIKEYRERLAERPHVARVYADRDVAFMAMMQKR
jgi:glutathione S-transferase